MDKAKLYLAIFFICLPFGYLAAIYGDLPNTIPIHWNWRGIADGFGPKWVLWLGPVLGVPFILLINAALTRNIDDWPATGKQRNIAFITVAFTSLLICYIIRSAHVGTQIGLGGLAMLMGCFFAALGNYLPVLKQNPYVGIRTPGTLKSERKWRLAHRFGGKVFLAGGLLLVLVGLLFTGPVVTVGLLSIVVLMSVITLVYTASLPEEGGGFDDFV